MSSLMWIAIALVVLWVVSFIVLKIAAVLIHLLIIIAVVLFIVGLFTRRKA